MREVAEFDPRLHLIPRLAQISRVTAAFSTRHGGVSGGPFESLNLGAKTGDDPARVRENRQRFFGSFGVDVEQVARAEQVHGAAVTSIDRAGRVDGVDGLVTRVPDVALAIATADCAAVLLVDPTARVVGACHSGWRGTQQNIARNTVSQMVRLGAEPERLLAYVSPCISADRFEVGEEVATQFDAKYVSHPDEGGRPHVDLKAVIRDQLLEEGLNADEIEVSPLCTFERTDLFYSYRAESGSTGRMMGFIMLRDADEQG